MTARRFPIMGGWSNKHWRWIKATSIPWEIIAPHEKQALSNHCGQTLAELAQRGGLGVCEAIAVLEDRQWRALGDIADNMEELMKLVEKLRTELPRE